MAEITYREALRQGLREEMTRDDRVFIMGEDIGAYGGSYAVTRGFLDEGQHRGVAPSKVADAIEHALTASRPKARYLVGPNAKLAGHLVTRLPDRTRDALARFAGKRLERRGAKLRPRPR